MVRCNKELIKTIKSDIIDSEITPKACDDNLLNNADLMDFRTDMDDGRSFYEKTDFVCEDLFMTANEETLWSAIVGEIKTPKGALSNSVGQRNYGCEIWEYRGKNIDSLMVQEMEHYIVKTCIKYPEVKNVIKIDTKIGNKNNLMFSLKIDSIYGVFDGHIRIPQTYHTKQNWKNTNEYFNATH